MLLGSLLGIFYDFLKPPGNRHRVLADAVFSLAALWVWIYICFAVCRGDIRTVYLMGMFSGILLWEKSFGTSIQPLFSRFWRFFGVLGLFSDSLEKNFENCKNFVCICEKMGYNREYENL